MKIYKRFFDARGKSSRPLHALLNGQGCWLAQKPYPHVIESTSFRAILHRGVSDMTRSFELGQADEYYCSICRGIGDHDLINLYSSEEQARQHYEAAVSRHTGDSSHWQRVP
jgi:hypothetical protein